MLDRGVSVCGGGAFGSVFGAVSRRELAWGMSYMDDGSLCTALVGHPKPGEGGE